MAELLYGRNAVREALRAARRTFRVLRVGAAPGERGPLREIIDLAEQVGVAVEYSERKQLDRQVQGANHQGVILVAGAYPYVDLEDTLAHAQAQGEAPLLLLLDHLQDPQNVGTLLRTAEVVGVHGVVLPSRRAAAITPAVVNASSGATEHLRIASVTNMARSIEQLQREAVWVVGLEDDPQAQLLASADLDRSLALVVGAEGSGLARLVRERCDFLVRLPMRGAIASLNAAVAGSIALYQAWQQRTS